MRSELFLSRRLLLAGAAASALPISAEAASALKPYGATPSARQLAWHQLETYGFVHFSINTFTDREWGYGDESPSLFNPTDFSADQIAAAAKAGGLKALILTAKHHDGFCLWPSRFTEHSIKNSPYKDGKGDIVREMADACARAGLKFGIYLSPWDRNHADYGRPEYVTYYRNQLRELLTQYGTLFEVWFDGANGGDGYYGGAREVRKIGPNYYNWPSIIAFVHELQPMAVTFDPKGADLRWVGNEEGYAKDPCWATMDDGPFTEEKGMSGVRGGSVWWPAEVDVSIRPGWFWHAYEDAEVKSPGRLQKIYFESVGRGTNLLLNLPPDRRGRIPDQDVASLKAWGDARRALFARNLAKGATAKASGAHPVHPASAVLDDRRDTFWAHDARAADLVLTLPEARTFDVVRLREHLPLGLRVSRFALDAWSDGWREIAQHEGIGAQRLVRLASPVTTRKLRLRVLDAPAGPAISEISLFRQPVLVDPPAIQRDYEGRVSIIGDAPGLELRYTLDGSAPGAGAVRFTTSFDLPEGGLVRAVAIDPTSGVVSGPAERRFDVRKSDWKIASASAPGAEALIDDGRGSTWRASLGDTAKPCAVTLDLGQARALRGFTLLPAWDRPRGAGAPAAYRVMTSLDGMAWAPAAEGEFSNIAASLAPQRITFAARQARYLKLEITRAAKGEGEIVFAELGVITTPED